MSFRPLLEQVREVASGERALASVRALARFHRVQASPGYDSAAAWLRGEIERIGLTPEVESVPGDGVTRFWGCLMPEGWECRRAVATLVQGSTCRVLCDYDACRLSLVLRSAPARGRFPIVALEDGSEDAHYDGIDVRGRVVLTRGAAHRVHTLAVVERGAAGLLCDGRRLFPPVRDFFDDPDQVAYTSFWWNGDEPRCFGFVVSPREGEALRARLRAGAGLELEVDVDSRRFATAIPLVSARMAGEIPGDVLVLAHLCHPEPSANDNASGAAAALETARVLAELARRQAWRPRRGVRFLWVPELTGTYAWLARDPGRAAQLVAGVNLDMIGESQELCGSTFLIEHPPCFAASFAEELLGRIRAEAVDWVRSYSGPGHYSLVRMAEVPYSGGSDHAVLNDPQVFVPCPMLIQWPDRFYHSSHDTPDKTDPRSLELAVRCAATYAATLAALDREGLEAVTAMVARGARMRVLRALEHADPGRAVAGAALAGRRRLASLERLGAAPARVAEETERLEAFVAREAGTREPAAGAGDMRVPRRLVPAPLESQRHLVGGVGAQDRAERERFRRLELDTPNAATLFELAWYACDGARTVQQIAGLVWLETGADAGQAIAEFFEWTARRGLSEWTASREARWSSSAPATATP